MFHDLDTITIKHSLHLFTLITPVIKCKFSLKGQLNSPLDDWRTQLLAELLDYRSEFKRYSNW